MPERNRDMEIGDVFDESFPDNDYGTDPPFTADNAAETTPVEPPEPHAVAETTQASGRDHSAEPVTEGRDADMPDAADVRMKLLSVKLGEAEYAFPLAEIAKIIPSETLEEDPIAPDFVAGAMTIGEERLAVLDLRQRLGVGKSEKDQLTSGCVMIIEYGDLSVGFLIDAVGSLFDVEESSLQKSDWVGDLAQSNKNGIGFIEAGEEALEAISFKGMVSEKELKAVNNWRGSEEAILKIAMQQEVMQRKAEEDALADNPLREHEGAYLIFRVGDELLGIRTILIAEVLPRDSLVHLPLTAPDFAGVLVLRGVTHPVMDLRRHFDLPEGKEENAETRPAIILVKDGENQVGLYVQQVVQLSEIEVRQIQPREDARIGVHQHVLTVCANLEIGQAALIDVPAMLADEQQSLIGAWEEVKAKSAA